MQEITISLIEKLLKLSTISPEGFKGISADLDNTEIETITKAISDLIPQITTQSPKKLTLNFIVEPKDVIFKFITVRKQDSALEDYIISEIREKLGPIALEDLYFSYHKIAPFIYQFVGIQKLELEKYLTISNSLGISLKSIVPWVFALPDAVDTHEPAIFLSKTGADQTVVLSEFGSIFFSSSFAQIQTPEQIQKLVEDLSIYKRKEPINKIYTFMYQDLHLNTAYDVTDVNIPNVGNDETQGYEFHLLVDYVMDLNPDLLFEQINLLTLLPLPVAVDKKSVPMVYVGAVLSSLLLIAGVIGGMGYLKNRNLSDGNQQVLSEATQQIEVPESTPSATEEKPVDLNRSDLVIRVENGAGIPGIAGKTQTFLEDKGYKVEGVGNADESDRESTLLKFKKDKFNFKDILTADMQDKFSVAAEDTLPDTAEYDVLVVVGTDAKL